MNKQLLTIAGTAGVSLVVGAATGYLVAQKRLQRAYDAILAEEVEATKDFYSRLHKTEFATPEEAAKFFGLDTIEVVEESDEEKLLQVVREHRYAEVDEEENTPAAQLLKNIFQEHGDDWDAEVAARTEDEPYIIDADEFGQNDGDHNQVELTYFEGDGVLADERDEHMNDPEKFIGDGSLLKFGYHSEDPNVVYIRNELLEMDFCVKRSTGAYRKEVLGFVDPPQRRPRRA